MTDWEKRLEQRTEEVELATYFAKQIIEELGEQKALEIIKKAWVKKGVDYFSKLLDGVPTEKRLEAFGLSLKEQSKIRPELKVLEVTPKRVRMIVSKCLWYDAFKKLEMPEICQAHCDSDYLLARAIHPKVKITRDKEIAYGAEYCNHCWVMEDKLPTTLRSGFLLPQLRLPCVAGNSTSFDLK